MRIVDWRDCKLGDLLQIKHGFAFLGEHFASAGTHIVLTPGNFLEEGGFKEKSDKAKWYNGPIPTCSPGAQRCATCGSRSPMW